MTKNDFFNVLIKVFGLFAIILTLLTIIPINLPLLLGGFDGFSILKIILSVVLAIGIYALLIVNTKNVISWLKLDQGFDEDQIIFGNLSRLKILKFSLILIACFLILSHISGFLYNIFVLIRYLYVGEELQYNFLSYLDLPNYYDLSTSILNIIIGYLILTNHDRLANWIDRKHKQDDAFSNEIID